MENILSDEKCTQSCKPEVRLLQTGGIKVFLDGDSLSLFASRLPAAGGKAVPSSCPEMRSELYILKKRFQANKCRGLIGIWENRNAAVASCLLRLWKEVE